MGMEQVRFKNMRAILQAVALPDTILLFLLDKT